MTVEQIIAPDRESITTIEESLDTMLARLRAIVAEPALTDETLVEIMAIYNNVAYVYLYLEAIDDEENYRRLLPRRAAFHEDDELDARILAMLEGLRCADAEVEKARLEYVDQLRRSAAYDPAADRRIEELLNDAKVVLDRVRDDQTRLLERIGARETGNPQAVYYKLISGTSAAATRGKLARAWRAQRDRHTDELVGIIDSMTGVRRADCAATGYASVLARSMARSRVTEAQVEAFIDRHLVHAITGHEELMAEIRAVTGVTDDPADHFGHAVRAVLGGRPTPLFGLEECLEFVLRVAHEVFGVTLRRVPDPHPDIVSVEVHDDAKILGHIKFDLWGKGGRYSANHTNGIRNRTDWNGLVQRPVAYVACRFQAGRDGTNRITFQNVHSLFHEFGHAMNHVLVRGNLSFQSGLEYLPPERLECLSMWFEKWVYHPEFEHAVADGDGEALDRCRRIKMIEYRRTYLERGVSAALDFEVNRSGAGGLRAAWDRLDERLVLGRHLAFDEFPAYFTWPMYMAKPGANFSYLWGSADSCAKFAPFASLSLTEVGARPELREMFGPCLEFDAASPVPDTEAVFSFFDRARLT